ncbi:MAG: hypothetical protein H6708_31490 [Kofleriaceae bacterium]|nr:hypothetical protein [Myxococcales bacterium]MCB9564932.1 hypothetical protein [Kofleriaceae bacterium]
MHPLLDSDDISVERVDGKWRYTRSMVEPTCVYTQESEQTDEQVLADGPPSLPSGQLERIARELGREPLDMPWYRDRLLRERIAGDDLEGVRALLDAPAAELLTLAIEARAWRVAAELVERGATLVAPPRSKVSPIDFLVARLDDGGVRLLDLIDLAPLDGLLRLARTPGVARKLIALGTEVEACGPAGHTMIGPELGVATPLMVAVVLERFAVAEALLEAGASLETRDAHGRTPLEFASWWGRESSIAWLRERTSG